MRRILRAACFGTALALLVACGPSPGALTSAIPSQQRSLARPNRGSADLIYAGNKGYVEVFAFPQGSYVTAFGTSGVVNGMCSDSKGDVFVASGPAKPSESGYVEEYSHGGKAPIATLDVPKNQTPIACSSDSTTGNLAVTMQNTKDYEPSVAVYAKAGGTPTIYKTSAIGADPQAGYDDKGDLFATSGGNVAAELPEGKTSFSTIVLSKTLGGVAHVQWDGKYFALQSFYPSKHQNERLFERVCRVQVSGSAGTIVSTVEFNDWPEKNAGQSWIEGGTIVATPYSKISFWAYPAGGKPQRTVHSPRTVRAITVSNGA
jgi:hypothetical protein